jgi:Ca2+-binding EF-hand superfamily protein
MSAPSFRAALVLALALGAAGTCLAQGKVPSTADARFAALDRNHDGVVSKDEYSADALFSALDADHNYRITASELDAVLGPQGDGMPSAADRIRNLDRNGDGELNDEEMRNAAETRFQWLDKNQDGKLDLSELKSGFGVPLSRP